MKTTLFGNQCRECGVLTIYADDSTFTISNKKRNKNQACLKRVLIQLKDYLSDNRLVLNLQKTSLTEIMVQQKKGKTIGTPPSLVVRQDNGEDKEIKDAKYTRILGANIACNMLWNTHLEAGKKALLPQIRKQLGQLKHHGRMIPLSSRKMIANGLLKSKLNYLMSQWGSADETHIGKVQITLNSIARWVTGKDKRTRIKTLMELTGWNTIREQIQIATGLQIWKLVNEERPLRLLRQIELTEDRKLVETRPRLISSNRCFRWRSADLWNNFSQQMRDEKSVSTFKRMLRTHIQDLRTNGQTEPD